MSAAARGLQADGSVVSTSTEQTVALGRALGGLLEPGDVLVLTGDLGAGKTQLTKGVAQGLGILADVTSPTFTIQCIYEGGRLPLYHFDLYRLSDADELGDAGVYDALDGDGACLIEWGEQFADELGDERLDVTLERMDGVAGQGAEPARRISFAPHGARARELADGLARALAGAPGATNETVGDTHGN